MTVTSDITNSGNDARFGPVTRAIRAMQAPHDPMRGNIESMLRGPVSDPHPDAELIKRLDLWLAADAAYDRVIDQQVAAADLIDWPKSPDALFLREEDRVFGFQYYATMDGNDRLWFYLGKYQTRENAGLRRIHRRAVRRPVRPDDKLPADAISIDEMFPWPEKQARADEITQAWDDWRAEIAALRERVGLPALEAEACDRAKHSVAISTQIEKSTAHTVAGLQVKARYAREIEEDGNALDPEFWTGLVNDILALGSSEVAA